MIRSVALVTLGMLVVYSAIDAWLAYTSLNELSISERTLAERSGYPYHVLITGLRPDECVDIERLKDAAHTTDSVTKKSELEQQWKEYQIVHKQLMLARDELYNAQIRCVAIVVPASVCVLGFFVTTIARRKNLGNY